jgi:hypothetical protein
VDECGVRSVRERERERDRERSRERSRGIVRQRHPKKTKEKRDHGFMFRFFII